MEDGERMKSLMLYSFLYILDGVTTKIGLNKGLIEGNPFFNFTGKIIMFFILLVVFSFGLRSKNLFTNKVTKYSLMVSNILLVIIVLNNIISIGG